MKLEVRLEISEDMKEPTTVKIAKVIPESHGYTDVKQTFSLTSMEARKLEQLLHLALYNEIPRANSTWRYEE